MKKILIISTLLLLGLEGIVFPQSKMDCENSAPLFHFLTNEIDNQEEIIKQYDCRYPIYINTNFNFEGNGKQKYPNPCSPSGFRNFIIFIPDSSSFTYTIYDENRIVLYSHSEIIVKSGLYSLGFENFYVYNIIIQKSYNNGDRRMLLFQHKVKIAINKKEFEHKVMRY